MLFGRFGREEDGGGAKRQRKGECKWRGVKWEGGPGKEGERIKVARRREG